MINNVSSWMLIYTILYAVL